MRLLNSIGYAIWFVIASVFYLMGDLPNAQFCILAAIFFVLMNIEDKDKP